MKPPVPFRSWRRRVGDRIARQALSLAVLLLALGLSATGFSQPIPSMLKRTVPIYQDKHDPERGITYIGDGGLGVPQRVPDLTRWYLKSPGFATPAHHVHLIEFADEEIRVAAIGLDRRLLDRFVLKSKLVPAAAAQ